MATGDHRAELPRLLRRRRLVLLPLAGGRACQGSLVRRSVPVGEPGPHSAELRAPSPLPAVPLALVTRGHRLAHRSPPRVLFARCGHRRRDRVAGVSARRHRRRPRRRRPRRALPAALDQRRHADVGVARRLALRVGALRRVLLHRVAARALRGPARPRVRRRNPHPLRASPPLPVPLGATRMLRQEQELEATRQARDRRLRHGRRAHPPVGHVQHGALRRAHLAQHRYGKRAVGRQLRRDVLRLEDRVLGVLLPGPIPARHPRRVGARPRPAPRRGQVHQGALVALAARDGGTHRPHVGGVQARPDHDLRVESGSARTRGVLDRAVLLLRAPAVRDRGSRRDAATQDRDLAGHRLCRDRHHRRGNDLRCHAIARRRRSASYSPPRSASSPRLDGSPGGSRLHQSALTYRDVRQRSQQRAPRGRVAEPTARRHRLHPVAVRLEPVRTCGPAQRRRRGLSSRITG